MGSSKEFHVVEDPLYEREGRGRSEKKRAAQAIGALALEMIESSEAVCKRLPVPEDMREVLDLARRSTARGARKRELKHLAALLRRDEETVDAVRIALNDVGRSSRADRNLFHRIEDLRNALCDPDRFAEALETAAAEVPGLDRQVISRLARRVHANGDKRAFREIFRRLRVLVEASSEK
jgi:ribosome-associated protein